MKKTMILMSLFILIISCGSLFSSQITKVNNHEELQLAIKTATPGDEIVQIRFATWFQKHAGPPKCRHT